MNRSILLASLVMTTSAVGCQEAPPAADKTPSQTQAKTDGATCTMKIAVTGMS